MREFWLIVGSQHLYGEEVLKKVKKHGEIIAGELDKSPFIPWKVKFATVATTSDEIVKIMDEANYDENCAGIMTWMHTFSPSKMWIRGFTRLNKPYLHMNTQFNREIPWDEIDMDFMNLNQSAHGDREHGFIGSRLRLPRKVVVGYWEDKDFQIKIGNWMRSAISVMESKTLNVARFGDNMREVAVTEGDKVEAQIKLGWSINYYPMGDLVKYIENIEDKKVDELFEVYREKYKISTDNIGPIKYQARLELGMRKFLEDGKFSAFTTTFEDLYGLEQLPGLAVQRLMEDGFGFGAEGDWKTAALGHIMKIMASGLEGGTSFMEDYTYHLEKNNELILGAHMLEVDPTIADDVPTIEVHDLDIGGKNAPARMVFDGKEGDVILASLVDLGGRMRLIVNDAVAVKPLKDMPNLPVARVMWKPLPDLQTAAEAWILSGGAHHTVMSYALTADHMRDFAEMAGIEFIHINKDTNIVDLKKELAYNDILWKFK
ncbi:L-arabinose isomerase [Paratissierella segnis]|uniref:L-arabinose isomerase n=1 Tax=Paratissierella segnis TaxID=2763679 RepID=A0A926IL43_9FIRM|nr:L-arabinose isomerase [Paratissierella segnis]MBC8588975.1 L-arabinose isomerase [Paratissierella segnis]